MVVKRALKRGGGISPKEITILVTHNVDILKLSAIKSIQKLFFSTMGQIRVLSTLLQ